MSFQTRESSRLNLVFKKEIYDSLNETSLLRHSVTAIFVRIGEVGIEGDGLVVVGDGSVQVALSFASVAPVVVGVGVARVQLLRGADVTRVESGLVLAQKSPSKPSLSDGQRRLDPALLRHRQRPLARARSYPRQEMIWTHARGIFRDPAARNVGEAMDEILFQQRQNLLRVEASWRQQRFA